ncbi:hypothetical protein BJ322DRAFT_148945 [Thelephora terrestris]|uniref:F-box domain-containing protein n=1 Tax=Thelephora terrestris TaxID=56493 RepID=A0A9P6L4W3_9AGAM|nr:hypothetical protein BJ322DRAFT_148945 [Thelephora terrestris]
MDAQHERPAIHQPTLHQLLQALNEELLAQTVSGQLASDHSSLRSMELQTKHALSKIHFSINTFPKINRLPPEVLALIPSFLGSHRDLITATHVCTHWRNTIIASPTLWSCLDNDAMHEDLVAAYVDRCGGAPLYVTFSPDMSLKNTSLLEKIIPRSSHIRKLCFPRIPWSLIGEFSNAFKAPLPLLREVDIDISYDLEPPPFEREFLAGATNLVSLSLRDCDRQSGTLFRFVIPSLTHLKLHFDDPRIPSVGELLTLFRSSPLIEDLHIQADIVLDASEDNPAFPDRFQSVDLPCLRKIHLDWITPRSQYTLLTHINYPPTCSVSTQTRSDSDLSQTPQDVFPNSSVAFPLSDLSSITLRMKRELQSTECAVFAKKVNGASVSISHSQDVSDLVFRNEANDLVRVASRDQDDDHLFSGAISFIGKLPLHLVRRFVLEDLSADQMANPKAFKIPPALAKLIRSDLPNLTTLSFTRTCVSELLDILSPPPPPPPTYLSDLFGEGDAPETALPCPTLKILEMRHPNWVASQHCRQVLALAKARKYEKVPFERMFLCSPVVPKSMATGMSLYVNDFTIEKCKGCE